MMYALVLIFILYLSYALSTLEVLGIDCAEVKDYVVVVKHDGEGTLDRHFTSLSHLKIHEKVKKRFIHLEEMNVHAYIISDENLLSYLMINCSSVEYIEKVNCYSVSPYDLEDPTTGTHPTGTKSYEIPDFAKTPLTTFWSSDSACTISYEKFRIIANLPQPELPESKSVNGTHYFDIV